MKINLSITLQHLFRLNWFITDLWLGTRYKNSYPFEQRFLCVQASACERSLEKLDNKKIESPDVIFLDINMPVMDGWQCLSILKWHEEHKVIPVIMYSTSSGTEDVETAQRMGAIRFFTKPADFKSLKRILDCCPPCKGRVVANTSA